MSWSIYRDGPGPRPTRNPDKTLDERAPAALRASNENEPRRRAEDISTPTVSSSGRLSSERRMPRLWRVVGVIEIARVLLVTAWVAVQTSPASVRRPGGAATGLLKLVRMLGPLYVKMVQIFAAQSGLLGEDLRTALRSSFDRNPAMKFARVRRRLESELGRPLESVFGAFDQRPIGVGSIAQVHRAVLRDGEEVVVKVVKPGVERSLPVALQALKTLVGLADVFPAVRGLRLRDNFHDIEAAVSQQLDLLAEAGNQERIGRSFLGVRHVKVPRVYRAYCTRFVLVMEFVAGAKGYEPENAGFDRSVLAKRLHDIFYTMVYLHGRFHVDPHPGNVLFGADGQLVLLDFGMIGDLDEDQKWRISAFYYACVRCDWRRAVSRFVQCFVDDPRGVTADDERFSQALIRILRRHFGESRTGRWSTVGFVAETYALLRERGLRIQTGMPLLILCMLTGEGFLEDVDPAIDIWANARRFTDRASPYMSDEIRERFDRSMATRAPRSRRMRMLADDALVAPTHLDRFFLPSEYPLVVARAEGAWLEDIDGNRFVDLSCGYGPHILGYGHEAIRNALGEAVACNGVTALATPQEIHLAAAVKDALPSAEKVLFANSGSEAALIATRLCRAFTGKQRVAKFEGHFHGQSDQGLVSAWFRFSGPETRPHPISGSRGSQQTTVDSTLVLPYRHADAFKLIEAHRHELACVICEPMPTATCTIDGDYLAALADVCRACGVPLVFDEVVSAFRVAYGGVQSLVGVTPDLTCLGKVIGGGLPCGAVAGRAGLVDMAKTTNDPFVDVEERTFVGGTFSGNALTCAAGLAVLRFLKQAPQAYETLAATTSELRSRLIDSAADCGVPLQVACQPGILAMSFAHQPAASIRGRLMGGNFKANLALSYYMRERQVYLPELHTLMIGLAHGRQELEVVQAAFIDSVRAMKADGLFPS